MDFAPTISPDLALMPAGIFREVWGELGSQITSARPATTPALVGKA